MNMPVAKTQTDNAVPAGIDLAQLRAPFAPERISWRVGSTNKEKTRGMALAYITARDVMERLDSVCGAFGWQSEHTVSADGKKVTCRIGIRDPETGQWIWKSDGAGETDYEAEKGSYSDSLKRAAVAWCIGRYLYDIDSPWVEIEPAGKSYKIKDGELPKLRARLGAPPPKAQAPGAPDHQPDDGAGKIAAFFRRKNYVIEIPVTGDGKCDYEYWARRFSRAVGECDRLKSLDKLLHDNGANLVALKKHEPDIYRAVDRAGDQKRTQLSPGAAIVP